VNYGQSVTFTASVSAVASGAGTPTGSVTFLDNGSTLGTSSLDSTGVATYTTSSLVHAWHSIKALYTGDGTFSASSSSSLGETVHVTSSSTSLVTSNPEVNFGQPVVFTVSVQTATGGGFPSGTITFFDNGSVLGTGTLAPSSTAGISTASFNTASLPLGSLPHAWHSIRASYAGDTNVYASSTLPPSLGETVHASSTSTSLSVAPSPGTTGQNVILTATVSAVAPGAGTPTGSVTFLDGSTTLGTGTLSGGVATYSTSSLTSGSHTLKAVYGGDTNFTTSTSAGMGETIQ
jgi:hypothetical protein